MLDITKGRSVPRVFVGGQVRLKVNQLVWGQLPKHSAPGRNPLPTRAATCMVTPHDATTLIVAVSAVHWRW
jgi:hypothetical protein